MLTDMPIDEMLLEIGEPKMIFYETGIFPPFGRVAEEKGLTADPYPQRYFTLIDNLLDSVSARGRGLMAKDSDVEILLDEFCYNAICHGNMFDPNLMFSVKAFEGEFGVVVRIRDSGRGFDYLKAYTETKKTGGAGFEIARKMTDSIELGYEDNGSTANILLPSACLLNRLR
jgi:hypothetical protein